MNTNSTSGEISGLAPLNKSLLGRDQRSAHTESRGPKVLVIGTTSDYVDLLRQLNPARAIYLTAQSERNRAVEPQPREWEEITCDLNHQAPALLLTIQDHLKRWNSSVDAVACFDCESMELAAFLAGELSLSYPSLDCVRLCRDKFTTKNVWRQRGIPFPRHRLVQSADGVFDFIQNIDRPCVIKPLSGSGSELVFLCSSRKDCEKSTKLLLAGLSQRKDTQLYRKSNTLFIAEEFVPGDEFSCDFTIRGNRVEILRLTRKLKYTEKPFGTINGYMITDWLNAGLNQEALSDILMNGAKALGITESICMVDFIVDGDKITLLEITPRPGGDCIPFLLSKTAGFDILSYTLDFAQNRMVSAPVATIGDGLVALRLHAGKSGAILGISSNRLCGDPRLREVCIVRTAGHRISMPPADYDSWYLGYLIFQPDPERSVEQQCGELRGLLELEINNDDH